MRIVAAAAEQSLFDGEVRGESLGHAADLRGDFRADTVAGQKKQVGHVGAPVQVTRREWRSEAIS